MTGLYSNIKYPYHCYNHNTPYGDDGLACHYCMDEIAKQHDPHYQEKDMTEQFVVRDTTEIQEQSLIDFMAAVGYEPTYLSSGKGERLSGFYQPNFEHIGRARLSVNTAITMHNDLAEETFAKIKLEPYVEFREFVKYQANVDELVTLFAGTCKIVAFISATYSRKKGFVVHNHNVKFMSRRDQKFYGF